MARVDKPSAAALVLLLASHAMPVAQLDTRSIYWLGAGSGAVLVALGVAAAGWSAWRPPQGWTTGLILAAVTALAAFGPLSLLGGTYRMGTGAPGLWVALAGLVCLAWRVLETLARIPAGRLAGLAVPGLFGVMVLFLWEMVVRGFDIPRVLLPSPSQIAQVMVAGADTLAQDFRQTFLKSVLAGFVLGSGSGFAAAVLIDRSPFLQRGLLPLGALVSAIPIVGIAPIMVMWFGFDWQSKAAVIVIMTFFPMLVNTLAGLNAAGGIERDLMRSYAAGYWGTLVKLRLPNALPFVFNALKINSTLALIGAIVAEFFGTPIVGMGFRISTEVGRMNIDMVWATIAVAAVAGSAFYGALVLIERALTFWHPSFRS
jgi:NitT/TauT family transport system permease protein